MASFRARLSSRKCVSSVSSVYVCVSLKYLQHTLKSWFFTPNPPALPLRPRRGIWHNRYWVSLCGPAFLADRGAIDRHWGNFPGSGKPLDNHTFHGPKKAPPVHWLVGHGQGISPSLWTLSHCFSVSISKLCFGWGGGLPLVDFCHFMCILTVNCKHRGGY